MFIALSCILWLKAFTPSPFSYLSRNTSRIRSTVWQGKKHRKFSHEWTSFWRWRSGGVVGVCWPLQASEGGKLTCGRSRVWPSSPFGAAGNGWVNTSYEIYKMLYPQTLRPHCGRTRGFSISTPFSSYFSWVRGSRLKATLSNFLLLSGCM